MKSLAIRENVAEPILRKEEEEKPRSYHTEVFFLFLRLVFSLPMM